MAIYTGLPTVPIMYLRPGKGGFDTIGNAIDGGVNGNGDGISIEMGGGGIVTAYYERLVIEADDTERLEVINWLGARCNGGFRFVNVEIINDGIGPFPIINGKRRPYVTGIPHSDGSFFSDSSGYSQATVWGEIKEAAGVGAGLVKMRVYEAARDFRWSDWFSIFHPTKGWRAYRYWQILAKSEQGTETVSGATRTYKDYTLAIGPTIREAITVGTRVELARPKCAMKFPRGFTLPLEIEGWYSSRPNLQFIEAR